MELKDYETCKLVEELKQRESVDVCTVYPHETVEYKINGPAIILKVID